jgi:hypothetical protein
MVEVLLDPELLAAVVKDGILPAPLAPNPIEVLSFNQLNCPPDGVEEKVGMLAFIFGQKVSLLSAVKLGLGFTIMLNAAGDDWQPLF